jgi:hypothetical protein
MLRTRRKRSVKRDMKKTVEINVLKIIKKDETKKVRTYGRTVYINFDPKWIKKPLRMTEYIMSVTTNS